MRSVGQSATAGMVLASARFARSAYNVANVNTPNFQARSVDQVEPIRPSAPQQSLSASIAEVAKGPESHYDSGPPYHGEMGVSSTASTTDLGSEVMTQIRAVNAFRANLAMLKADDDRVRRQLNLQA
jgi:flagellar basal body rod protein FlgB